MQNYIIKRLFLIPITLLGILCINFAIIQLAPGGPVEYMLAQYKGMDTSATGNINSGSPNINEQKYQGNKGLPDDLIKELEKQAQEIRKKNTQEFEKILNKKQKAELERMRTNGQIATQ